MTPNEKRMLECLWRIAASDPTHSQFATLVLAEVRDTIEAVTGERPPALYQARKGDDLDDAIDANGGGFTI